MQREVHVEVRLGDDPPIRLRPGDLVGRLATAALRVDDPRISEAHALVSMRDGELRLLALRGALAVDRKRMNEIVLEAGTTIRLAKDCLLHVVAVHLPDQGLGLVVDGGEPELLVGGSASLILDPEIGLSHRFVPDAAAQLWSDGAGWRIRVGEASVPLKVDEVHEVGGFRIHATWIPLSSAGLDATTMRGRVHAPLRVVANYDSVHLHRDGQATVVVSGVQAKIFSELVAFGGPTDWELVAREIWKDVDRHKLRRRWDVNLNRLRARLAADGIRPGLLNADGTGRIELVFLPDDVVEDQM